MDSSFRSMVTALDHLMAGRFGEAISGYLTELAVNPDDPVLVAGLTSAYIQSGQYEKAIPLKYVVHERDKAEIPDSPGQLLYLSCAYWCLNDRERAIEFSRELCAGIRDRSINMAPDLAGGATFGLVLHYMAVTAGDDANRDYALDYLRRLNAKYNKKQPHLRYHPVQIVKHLLGEMTFEDALEGATKERTLRGAYRAADGHRSDKIQLGVALFHSGALSRALGDEAGCMERMQQVFDLGYQTESIRWMLARHEVSTRPKPEPDTALQRLKALFGRYH